MRRLPLTLLACAALAAALAAPAPGQPPAKLSPDTATLVKGTNAFALDLYRALAAKDGNLFFSPYSISNALAMTYAGARGETAGQMQKTLHFALGQERLHAAFHDLIGRLGGAGQARKYQLTVANRLWGQQDYGFLPEFVKLSEASYGAGLKEVDFIKAREEARQAINTWVEGQTKDKIKELIRPGILTVDSRLVLTNAIYFKAAWLRPFSPKGTAPGAFQVAPGNEVKVPLMRGSQRTNYFQGEGFEALELPYEQHDLSMVVLLPQAGGLAAFERKLTAANLSAWQRKLSDHQVDVTLPKFKVTAEFMLKPVLRRLGMPLAFDRGRADFSGMATRARLFISHVIHKAFVDVNEAGTEAAASTAVVMERLSAPPPATFHADRPFVYLLRDNRTGAILFLGRVTDPR
jgi:serpin B